MTRPVSRLIHEPEGKTLEFKRDLSSPIPILKADEHLISEMQRGVAGISYDALPMPHLSKEDLDIKAIEHDFGDKQVDDTMLQSLRIVLKEQGRLVPSHGGILLYGKDRRFHFDDAWIQCGRFIGSDKSDIFDHIDIQGTMPAAVGEIMLFLKKHAMRGADFSEIRRKDIWSIPIDILREVVINALVHADYSQRGAPIRIAFFDDRIEVENPGLLMPGLTIEDIKQGISKIRNPVIARVFKELEYIEQWGSGIHGIFKKIEEQQLPQALIEEIGMRIRFTVYLKEIAPLTADQSRSGKKAPEEAPVEAPEEAPVELSGTESRILDALSLENLGRSMLLEKLGYKQRSGNYKKAIAKLLDKGWIEMTIPDKPNSRLQKYRITEKGKALINEG
jgi:ATP-dependent DNA helicase RecG